MPGTYSQFLPNAAFATQGRTLWITQDVAERLHPDIGGFLMIYPLLKH